MTDVFAALGDPTRRTVYERLAAGSATATQLAADLPVTRQAVAKHLAVLEDAGLVRAERAGRERRFSPTPAPLGEAISWMAAVGGQWDDRLRALDAYVQR
jgi:DNA-binding transcriptional ArsR family regulator